MERPSVLIVGAGAIGAFYGAILHRAGAHVSVVVRSDHDVVADAGYRIDSPLGDLSFRPAAVYRSADQCPAPPDYLVVTLKVVDGVDRVAVIRPAVGSQTTIVLIANGVEIEPEVADAFPDNPLLSGLAFVAVSRVAAGRIEHKAYGRLVLGDYPVGVSAEARRFGGLIDTGGVRGKLTGDVVGERWRKCIWNAAFNPVSVLAGGADTQTLMKASGGEEFLGALMSEVCDVAAACGYPMADGLIPTILGDTRGMPPYRTSMALDFLNGRPMEVEAILGNVVRAGERQGVEVPRLSSVYALMKMRMAEWEGRLPA